MKGLTTNSLYNDNHESDVYTGSVLWNWVSNSFNFFLN
jgi:hypothetical protein